MTQQSDPFIERVADQILHEHADTLRKLADEEPTRDGVGVVDNVHIVLRGPDGQIKHESVHNTVTTAGKNGAADQILASPTLAKPGWMAIGTGSPAATLLGTEIDRNALTS